MTWTVVAAVTEPASTTAVVVPALSVRQSEILTMIADGMSNAEIGGKLFVSEDTVKTHVRRMFKIIGAANRAQAVGIAYRLGLLRPAAATPEQPTAVSSAPARASRTAPARVRQNPRPRPAVVVSRQLLAAVQAVGRDRTTLDVVRAVLQAAGVTYVRSHAPDQLVLAGVRTRRPVVVITEQLLTHVQGAVLTRDPMVIACAVLEAAGLASVRPGSS
jgi:DNA-binding CsgD family transcriptional regulator